MLRSFGFDERLNEEEHALVREILERAVEKAPAHGDCWARLAQIYADEHMNGHNPRPDPLGRALSAAAGRAPGSATTRGSSSRWSTG